MRQLLQSLKDGSLRIIEAPTPSPGPTDVLVSTSYSLVSAGTEKAVRELASAGLLGKAKARPDLVRQVLAKARAEGVQAAKRAVRNRLQDEMPLGYSAAGRVIAVGEAVNGIVPGMRVATASAGHGDHQLVPGLLAVPIPERVTDSQAAFGAVAAIALQGLRQAEVQVGGTVAVIGLGLIGQLTARMAVTSGLNVIGIDLKHHLVQLASTHGATGLPELGEATTRSILEMTRGQGVDAVVITAATSSSEPAMRSTRILRDRGRLVIVGDVGLSLKRTPFYEKELEIRFARSYGPGRYERTYEDYAIDYPIGHVRWTEGRNIEAYLDLVASNRLVVDDLVSRTYRLDEAQDAYEALGQDGIIGVQFTYGSPTSSPSPPISVGKHVPSGTPSIGLVGAGNFVCATLLPAFPLAGMPVPSAVTSSGGSNATRVAQKFGIPHVARTYQELLDMADIDTVMVATSHESHTELAVRALRAGKHVFLEKPWALSQEEFLSLREAYEGSGRILWPGFNRRYAPALTHAMAILRRTDGPLAITYRINAGALPDDHWYNDRRQGGRVLGEVCHFVDAASWIVGTQPVAVSAMGDGRGEVLMQQGLAALLSYADGSTASIVYNSDASPRTGKEHLEILGRGHTIGIDNFATITIDGRRSRKSPTSKGHSENLEAFREALRSEEGTEAALLSTEAAFGTTRTLFAIASSMMTRCTVNPQDLA